MKCPKCGKLAHSHWIIFNHGPFFPNIFRFCVPSCSDHGCFGKGEIFPRPENRPRVAKFMVVGHNLQRIKDIESLQRNQHT